MKIATGKKGSNPILRRWRKAPFILDRICQTCPSNKGFKTIRITISTGYLQPSNRQTRSTAKLRWRKVARATPAWLSRWPEWFSGRFQIFFMFTPIWGWFSFCLILFEGVETTNSFFFMLFCLMTFLKNPDPSDWWSKHRPFFRSEDWIGEGSLSTYLDSYGLVNLAFNI